jgi:hypothetical protein
MRSCIICAEVKLFITIIPIGCIILKDTTLKEKIPKRPFLTDSYLKRICVWNIMDPKNFFIYQV